MISLSREILDRYQIRKTKKQKTAFIQWLQPELEKLGYEMKIEKGSGARNIVIGDVDRAKVLFAAHYDTCAVMPIPNFITPKCIPIYIVYQIVLTLRIFAFIFGLMFLGGLVHRSLILPAYYVGLFFLFGTMFFGPANKHTVNDNTSGVTTVLELMEKMPEQQREKVAFVLFDLEEAGLFGSSAFASKHKKEMKDKLLVNLDCVSDGETMLFCFRKKSKQDVTLFKTCFPSGETVVSDFVTKGYIYPSDQISFPRGVGVAALKKTKGGLLYMDKIPPHAAVSESVDLV